MWRPDRGDAELGEDDVRELEILELVLAGAPAAELGSGGDQLSRLVGAVRADHPPLRADFADELAARVRGGFARPAGPAGADAPGRLRRGLAAIRGAGGRAPRGRWLAGAGAAASLAIGAVVVGGVLSGSSPGGRAQTVPGGTSDRSVGTAAGAPGGPAASGAAPTPAGTVYRTPSGQLAYSGSGSGAAPAKGAGGGAAGVKANSFAINRGLSAQPSVPSVPPPASTASGATASGGARAVESDATLALLAPRGRVQQVADEAIAATDRLGGIVESSNVTVADQGGSQATLALEVPSGALDRTLAAISALAHVSSRSQDTQDITDPTNAARQRLTESRAERTALLRQLGGATTPNQVASIRGQLGLVDGRIAADETSLQRLVGRASMASVSVTIAETGRSAVVGAGSGSGSPWRPSHAVHAALGVLEAVFAVLVIGLAGLVPAAALAALGWWVARAGLRRRRQGALARTG